MTDHEMLEHIMFKQSISIVLLVILIVVCTRRK